MIFAVGGRVIQSLHGLTKVVRNLDHARQQLRMHLTACRPVIPVDLSQRPSNLGVRVHGVLLGCERSNDPITGFGGPTQGHAQLPALFRYDATRDLLRPATGVVSAGLGVAPGDTAARTLPKVLGRLTIDAQAMDTSCGQGVGLLFVMLAKIASISLLCFCGLALTTWRRRIPLRLSPAALVEGADSGSLRTPGALSTSNAPLAGRRVVARGGRHVGSWCDWASACCRRTSATCGWTSSQRWRPLQADWTPGHLPPVRLSVRPYATV